MTTQSTKHVPNISPSAISSFYDPLYCGTQYKAVTVDRTHNIETLAMLKGKVFEYRAIGATTREGEVPELPMLASGKASADDIRIAELAQTFKDVIQDMNIEILDKQIRLEKNGHSGILDMLAMVTGEKSLVDLKYTETKEDDRWSPYAWGDLDNRDHTQPIHYIWLWHELHGEYLPFYYMVFGKGGWIKFIRVKVAKATMIEHEKKMEQFAIDVKAEADAGWTPKPDRAKCAKCPLFLTCEHAVTTPEIQVISV